MWEVNLKEITAACVNPVLIKHKSRITNQYKCKFVFEEGKHLPPTGESQYTEFGLGLFISFLLLAAFFHALCSRRSEGPTIGRIKR